MNPNYCLDFVFVTAYANDLTAYTPQLWALESIAVLEENMIIANSVHRDFEDLIADYGDTVNTRKPASFVSKRKTDADNVTVQDATATKVAVVLNQHAHVSFTLRDGESTTSFKNLVNEYLRPAMIAQAQIVDRVLLAQYARFMANAVGPGLGKLTTSNSVTGIVNARTKMNQNLCPMDDRKIIWTPGSEGQMLQTAQFTQAYSVGDDGTAMRKAYLGEKFGFQNFMCQNMASVPATANNTTTAKTGAINHAGGYNPGTTSLVVNVFTGIVDTNSWLNINGYPYRVVSHTETSSATTGIVITPGLYAGVANADVVTEITPGAVNNSGGYALGYVGSIAVNGFTNMPAAGQMVTFNTASDIYTIISADSTTIMLDRPLAAAISNSDAVNVSPSGDYNFAFHPNAIALVSRPLAPAPQGTGALCSVVNHNGVSMRVTMTYNGNAQGLLVTFDMLFGVALLDVALGSVILA